MKKVMEVSTIHRESNMYHIMKGIIVSILFTLISLCIFAGVLTYTKTSESTILPVIIIISALSILIGSSISTIKIKKHGLLNGMIVGSMYMVLLYVVSSMTKTGFAINNHTLTMMVCSVLAGMLGGIVGVNIK